MTELLMRCGAYTYFGAHPAETGYVFRVWAPHARCRGAGRRLQRLGRAPP